MQSAKEHLDHEAPENPRCMRGLCWGSQAPLRVHSSTSWLLNPVLARWALRATPGFLRGVREKPIEFGSIKNAPKNSLVKTGPGDNREGTQLSTSITWYLAACVAPFLHRQPKWTLTHTAAQFLSPPELSPADLLALVHSARTEGVEPPSSSLCTVAASQRRILEITPSPSQRGRNITIDNVL